MPFKFREVLDVPKVIIKGFSLVGAHGIGVEQLSGSLGLTFIQKFYPSFFKAKLAEFTFFSFYLSFVLDFYMSKGGSECEPMVPLPLYTFWCQKDAPNLAIWTQKLTQQAWRHLWWYSTYKDDAAIFDVHRGSERQFCKIHFFSRGHCQIDATVYGTALSVIYLVGHQVNK